jgi:hypothetical protein
MGVCRSPTWIFLITALKRLTSAVSIPPWSPQNQKLMKPALALSILFQIIPKHDAHGLSRLEMISQKLVGKATVDAGIRSLE